MICKMMVFWAQHVSCLTPHLELFIDHHPDHHLIRWPSETTQHGEMYVNATVES
jgi:hypothetical protein